MNHMQYFQYENLNGIAINSPPRSRNEISKEFQCLVM